MILDGQGLRSPWAVLIYVRDFAPAIATLIVTRLISPLPNVRQATGVRWGVRGSRWGLYWLFGCIAIPLLVYVIPPLVGALFGVVSLDLAHFSGYRAYVESPDWPGPALGGTPSREWR